MGGLLMKELCTAKKNMRQYVALFIVFILFSFYLRSPLYLQTMLTMIMGMQTLTGISYDNLSGWDKFVLTLPVDRRKIVLSKYVITLIFLVLAMIAGTGGTIAVSFFIPAPKADPMEIFGVSIFMVSMVVFIYASLFPLLYKFGVERARMLMLMVVALPTFLILSSAKFLPAGAEDFIESHILLVMAGIFLFCMVIYAISFFISLRIYEKEEF